MFSILLFPLNLSNLAIVTAAVNSKVGYMKSKCYHFLYGGGGPFYLCDYCFNKYSSTVIYTFNSSPFQLSPFQLHPPPHHPSLICFSQLFFGIFSIESLFMFPFLGLSLSSFSSISYVLSVRVTSHYLLSLDDSGLVIKHTL